jgi:hypothetical protein
MRFLNYYKINIKYIFVTLALWSYPIAASISVLFNTSPESSLISNSVRVLVICLGIIILFKKFPVLKLNLSLSNKFLFIFLFIYLFRIIYDFYLFDIVSLVPKEKYLYSHFFSNIFGLFVLSTLSLNNNDLKVILKASKYIILICLIINLYFGIDQYIYAIISEVTSLRISNLKFSPIQLGHLSAILILLSFFKFDGPINKISIFDKFSIVLALIGVILANSKAPILALVIIFAIYFYSKNRSIIKFYISFLFFCFFILVTSILAKEILLIDISSRFLSTFNESEVSTTSRLYIFSEGIDLFFSNPIIGSRSVTSSGGYPHNLFIEILMSTGMVGIILISLPILKLKNVINEIRFGMTPLTLIYLIAVEYFIAFQTSFAMYQATNLFILLFIIGRKKNIKNENFNII